MKLLKEILKGFTLACGLVLIWTLNFFIFCAVFTLVMAALISIVGVNLQGFSFGTAVIDLAFLAGSYFLFKSKRVQKLARDLRDQMKRGF